MAKKKHRGLRGLGGTRAEHAKRAVELVDALASNETAFRRAKSCSVKLGALTMAERRLGRALAEGAWVKRGKKTFAPVLHASSTVNSMRHEFERHCVCSKKGR